MSLGLLLIVLSAATFRLTRLVTRDDFPPIAWARGKIQHARAQVWTRAPAMLDGMLVINPDTGAPIDPGEWRWWWAGELVSCHWCCSAYIAAGAVGFADLVTSVPLPVACWLAVWGAGAVLVDRLG
jgi:hypothetical protein